MEIPEIRNPLSNGNIVGENMPVEVYQRQDAKRGDMDFIMGRGELMLFDTCPRRWLAGYKSDGSGATEWGSLIDCMVLQPEKFQSLYAVTPETYPDKKTGELKPWNWNATFCKEWREDRGAAGKECVKSETFNAALTAKDALLKDGEIKEMLALGKAQVMVIAEYCDRETGLTIPLKTLVDLAPPGETLIDLKTCTSGHPRAWVRAIADHNYHVQAALYLDAWNCAEPDDKRSTFGHIIQESYKPWEVSKRFLSNEFVEIGRAKYLAALGRYCQCLKTGNWPGYDRTAINGWGMAEPEPWMVMQMEPSTPDSLPEAFRMPGEAGGEEQR